MIFESPNPDVEVPAMGVTDYVLRRAERFGAQPALIEGDSGETLTYLQLEEQVHQTAAGLCNRGLRKGDVVAVWMPNSPDFVTVFHGVALAGGVVAAMNPMLAPAEISYVLKDSGARFLVTLPSLLDKIRAEVAESSVEEIYVVGEAAGATPFASLRQQVDPHALPDIDPGTDLAVLPYSSGTTGMPKGVMLTHRNLVANLAQMEGHNHFPNQGDRLIALVPMAHIYGMQVIMNLALVAGATLVTMPKPDFGGFLRTVQQHRINRADVVPPLVLGLARHPIVDQFDLSSLEMVSSAAAPLDAATQQACSDRLGCLVKQVYGLTEASPGVTGVPDDSATNRSGSVGPIVPNTQARIVDPVTGEDLGPGKDGELLIRGPQVMKGYWSNPKATADAFDPEGWLRTGDLMRVDADGNFLVVDRLKELIKCGGANVAPAQLEAVLMSHPAVADAAVVGVPDKEFGELPKAYVVIREGQTAADEEIMAFVAEQVAPYKRIRFVTRVEAIPKDPTGKILRRLLKERERGLASRPDNESKLERAGNARSR